MPRRERKFNLDLKPSKFEDRVHRYFEENDEWTMAGLYLYLGIGKSKYDRLRKKPEYKDAVDYAQAKLQDQYERQLMGGKPTGAIFALKNMGWSDQAKIELATDGIVPVEQLLKGGKMKAK